MTPEPSRMVTQQEKSIDTTDEVCLNCSPAKTTQNKESVSISSSSDDDTEQTIPLNINKKSNIAYKGLFRTKSL